MRNFHLKWYKHYHSSNWYDIAKFSMDIKKSNKWKYYIL